MQVTAGGISAFSSSENQVEKQQKTEDHRHHNDVGSVATVTGNFLQTSCAQLKGLSGGADAVTLFLHHVHLALVLEHFVHVLSHFVSHCIKRFLNFVSLCLGGSRLQIEVCSLEVLPVERGLQLDDDMPRQRVETLDPLWILLEVSVALIKHIGEALEEVVCEGVRVGRTRDDDIGDHVAVLEDVPRVAEMLGFGSRASHLVRLAAKQRHEMVSNVLILVGGNRVAGLASGKDSLVTDSADTDEVDLIVGWSPGFDHF